MRAIYKRELNAYLNNMVGCVCMAFMLAATGLYFWVYNLLNGYPSFAAALESVLFLFLVTIPMLTMRSMAEERSQRTDQLLLTAPVRLTAVVMGKFLAMVTVFAIPCGLFTLYPLVMGLAAGSAGVVYWACDYASLLAFFLLGCVYIAIGMLVSSLTEHQMISAIGTFGVLIVLYLWDSIVGMLPTDAMSNLVLLLLLLALGTGVLYQLTTNPVIAGICGGVCAVGVVAVYVANASLLEGLVPNVLGLFSLNEVFSNFADHQLFDLGGLLMYASLAFLALFFTVQVIQRRRWN